MTHRLKVTCPKYSTKNNILPFSDSPSFKNNKLIKLES